MKPEKSLAMKGGEKKARNERGLRSVSVSDNNNEQAWQTIRRNRECTSIRVLQLIIGRRFSRESEPELLRLKLNSQLLAAISAAAGSMASDARNGRSAPDSVILDHSASRSFCRRSVAQVAKGSP
jgi:hypothetical protein